ncbi:Uncharacterized protein APZ42_027927 [Daphnia magna]|uniref:Uncharacterized protein n=1 Tax=Daphnia magna TaxID=35525 RepID=A0A164QYK0_9CRUS|nr:Uncharacterized protein APZ42_027927 [Daphnia magna]
MRQLHGLMDYSGIITLTHAPSINICTAHAQHSSHRSQSFYTHCNLFFLFIFCFVFNM